MPRLEAPYDMSNLFPKHTGLPFVVWISVRGGARHDVRVKVSSSAKALPGEMATVAIRPEVHIVEGKLPPKALRQLRAWVEANRDTLLAYWEGEMDTLDAMNALVKVESKLLPR